MFNRIKRNKGNSFIVAKIQLMTLTLKPDIVKFQICIKTSYVLGNKVLAACQMTKICFLLGCGVKLQNN